MILQDQCPIWGTAAKYLPTDGRDGVRVNSPRAGGKYFISGRAQQVVPQFDDHTKARLTTWLYEERRFGNTCPEITEYKLDEILRRKRLEISERANRILRYFGSRTVVVGTEVLFHMAGGVIYLLDLTANVDILTSDYCKLLGCSECTEANELDFLLDYLSGTGHIERTRTNNATQGCILTVPGIKRLSELDGINTESQQAFVAMWFDESTNDLWSDGIEPAVNAAGYNPIRIDKQHHANKICDEIVAEIKRSRFLVADFTFGESGARGGVYYEAGFAHGLGLDVIFCCHSDCMSALHFDTRQYNHIEWKDPAALREELTARICAVVGDGPNKRE